MVVLGIDTSNYRTSVCLIDEQYKILDQQNPLLPVKEGELGLSQSNAVFEHLKAWPAILSSLSLSDLDVRHTLRAVGVSVTPRPVRGSYMPVFKVGETLARTLSSFLDVPLFSTSHQEGHVAAGVYTADAKPGSRFLAVHLSGGTSEVLFCQETAGGYMIDRLGGTLDLHAGQVVDRVGVRLGLPFPAGPHLEALAKAWAEGKGLPQQEWYRQQQRSPQQDSDGQKQDDQSRDSIPYLAAGPRLPVIPSFVRGVDFSFSGPASAALRLTDDRDKENYPPGAIARAVENVIAKTLEKSLSTAMERTGCRHILLVGGVAANGYIISRLKHRLEHRAVGARLYVAKPQFATDNAYGVACLAMKQLQHSDNHSHHI